MRTFKAVFGKRVILPVIALCAMALPLDAANAALVQYSFTGTVGSAGSALRPTIPVGSSMSGTFSFDDTTTATGAGRYMGAVQGFSLNFDGYSVSWDSSGDINLIRIVDSPSGDIWRLRTSVMGDEIGAYSPTEFRLELEDEDGLALSGTGLQNPPSLGNLTSTQWRLVFENSNGSLVRLQGVLNSLTAVPLPAAVLLFGAGLISLVGLGAGGLRNLRGAQA